MIKISYILISAATIGAAAAPPPEIPRVLTQWTGPHTDSARWELADVAKTRGSGLPAYQVWQRAGGDGFAVVSADTPQPFLLAIAERGDYSALPPAARALLESYADAPNHTRAENAGTGWPAIEPMLYTRWGQDTPYNLLCPRVDSIPTYTGCVATAMAQIMNRYRHPAEHGSGSHSYRWGSTPVATDFDTIPLDWDVMQNVYAGAFSTGDSEADHAVARLMYACAASVDMRFGTTVSATYAERTAVALQQFFGYGDGCRARRRDYHNTHEWEAMIYDEISSGRPVLYCGTSGQEAHAFVCDGYRDGLFHINWGWDGSADGYYNLSRLAPQHDDGSGDQDFRSNQIAVTGISPLSPAVAPMPEILCTGDFTTPGTSPWAVGRTVDIAISRTGLANYSFAPHTFTPGLKVFGNGLIKYYQASSETTLSGMTDAAIPSGINSYEVGIPVNSLPEGTYRGVPAVIIDGAWHDVAVGAGRQSDILITIDADGNIDASQGDSRGPSPLSASNTMFAEQDSRGGVSTTVTASGARYNGTVSVIDLTGEEPAVKSTAEVALAEGESREIFIPFGHVESPGQLVICLADKAGRHITPATTIYVYEPAQPSRVILSDCHIETSPGCDGEITATVWPKTAADKTLTWSSSDPNVATVDGGRFTAHTNGQTTLTATTVNGVTATADIFVRPLPASVTLTPDPVDVPLGYTATLQAAIEPADAIGRELIWSSSDPAVIEVDDTGILTARSQGECVITATTANGTEGHAVARGVKVQVESISLTPTEIEAVEGTEVSVDVMVSPEYATDKSLIWASNHTSIARADNGIVSVTGEGEAEITVTAADGGGASATILVTGLSGIAETRSATCWDVTDLSGTTVVKDADAETLRALPKGVYILRSGNEVRKYVR